MIRGYFERSDCILGMILGSGFNAAYYDAQQIINMECGAMGDDKSLNSVLTAIDSQVDQESLFPGSFTYVITS